MTSPILTESAHPCLSCGACCASFRVDFAVYEMQEMGGTVPDHLAVDVNGSTCRMQGTDRVPIRCAALSGTVGQQVTCSIYDARPAPCREFTAGSYACNKARMRHGLAPIEDVPSLAPCSAGGHIV